LLYYFLKIKINRINISVAWLLDTTNSHNGSTWDYLKLDPYLVSCDNQQFCTAIGATKLVRDKVIEHNNGWRRAGYCSKHQGTRHNTACRCDVWLSKIVDTHMVVTWCKVIRTCQAYQLFWVEKIVTMSNR